MLKKVEKKTEHRQILQTTAHTLARRYKHTLIHLNTQMKHSLLHTMIIWLN